MATICDMPNELIDMIGSYLTDEDAVHYKIAVLHKVNGYKPFVPLNRMKHLPFWFKKNQVFICAEDCYIKITNVKTEHLAEKKHTNEGHTIIQSSPYHIRITCNLYYYGEHKTNKKGNVIENMRFNFSTAEKSSNDWSWVLLTSRHKSVGYAEPDKNNSRPLIITDKNYPKHNWTKLIQSYYDLSYITDGTYRMDKIIYELLEHKSVRFCMNKYNCVNTDLSVPQLHKLLTTLKNPSRFYIRGDTADTDKINFVSDYYFDENKLQSAEDVLHYLHNRSYGALLSKDIPHSDGTYPALNPNSTKI